MTKSRASVKWYPRLFTGDMVRALLDGRKTATRWPLRKQPGVDLSRRAGKWVWEDAEENVFRAPVRPGDVIWVRETWTEKEGGACYDAAGYIIDAEEHRLVYRASRPKDIGPWKPSIHMPRKYARIFLRVTDMKLVRVQDINEEEARAEGVEPPCFAGLWDDLYAARGLGWDVNPWVWAATFRPISKAEAEAEA